MPRKTSVWSPPYGSGISYKSLKKGANRFQLRWTDGTDERTKAYGTAAERELAARELLKKRTIAGDPVLEFDPEKWRRYLEFQKKVGPDVDPLVVADEWLASKQGVPRAVGMLVPTAIKRYIELRDQEKTWGADSRRHAVKHLSRFATRFATRALREIDANDIREWLYGRKDEGGKTVGVLLGEDGMPIGPHGQRDHLKNARAFFGYALREGWGAVANPCDLVAPPKIEEGDPLVIPLYDAFAMFKANRTERVVGRIALEAFGGIRYTSAGLIQEDAINFDRCGIRLSRGIHKSGKVDGRTRYRQGQPANLWDWLRSAPDGCWDMTALEYREAKRNAGIRAGLRPVENASSADAARMEGLRNIWRHSFISYHLARYKSLPLTQYLAQHASVRQTEEYEGLADEVDAARYFMINPQTVQLSWDEFSRLPVQPVGPVDSAVFAAIAAA